MVGFLVFCLILLVVIYVVKLVVDQLDLPANVKTIALLIVGVIGLVLILQRVGGLAGVGL